MTFFQKNLTQDYLAGIELRLHNQIANEFYKLITHQIKLGVLTMANLKDVQDAIAALSAAAAAEKVETDANVAASAASIATLTATVASLQGQLANGTSVSAADLQALVDSLNGVSVQVQAISAPIAPVV